MTIVTSHWGPNVELVPASPSLRDDRSVVPGHLRRDLRRVADHYDAVLIDCPPSLGNLTTSGLIAADLALIVVDPAALGLARHRRRGRRHRRRVDTATTPISNWPA